MLPKNIDLLIANFLRETNIADHYGIPAEILAEHLLTETENLALTMSSFQEYQIALSNNDQMAGEL